MPGIDIVGLARPRMKGNLPRSLQDIIIKGASVGLVVCQRETLNCASSSGRFDKERRDDACGPTFIQNSRTLWK